MTVDPGQVLTVSQLHIAVAKSNCKSRRSSTIFDTTSISRKQTKYTRKYLIFASHSIQACRDSQLLIMHSGCDPLTPDDVAEVIVFAAGRRENVVLADTLLFPNHQVCLCHKLPTR
jgi:hypothetical protein